MCITLGILLPVGLFDGPDFVHSFMRWFGHCSRERHVQLSRHRFNFFFKSEPMDKMPDSETHVIAHPSGCLVCSETSKVSYGHINDSSVCFRYIKHWLI